MDNLGGYISAFPDFPAEDILNVIRQGAAAMWPLATSLLQQLVKLVAHHWPCRTWRTSQPAAPCRRFRDGRPCRWPRYPSGTGPTLVPLANPENHIPPHADRLWPPRRFIVIHDVGRDTGCQRVAWVATINWTQSH